MYEQLEQILSSDIEDSIRDPQYFFYGVGIYCFLKRYSRDGFYPSMTVEQMMSKFQQLTNNQFNYEGRANTKFLKYLSYDFRSNSTKPPSAKKRPANGVRKMADGENVGKPNSGVKTVWQYYRNAAVINLPSRKSNIIRLYNNPMQTSYTESKLNDGIKYHVGPEDRVLAYFVAWRLVAIDFKATPTETELSSETLAKIEKRFPE